MLRADQQSGLLPCAARTRIRGRAAAGRAFEDVGRGLASFLTTTSPQLLAPLEPAIERYLSLTKFEVNIVALHDIVVADGATLTISDDTHLVEANNIVIHGSGQINCSGFTKMNVNSIEGTA